MPTHGRGEGMTAGATFAKRWEALRRAVRVSVPLVACDKGRSPKASQRPHVPRRGMYKRAFRTNVQNEGLLRAQLPPFLLFNKTFLFWCVGCWLAFLAIVNYKNAADGKSGIAKPIVQTVIASLMVAISRFIPILSDTLNNKAAEF